MTQLIITNDYSKKDGFASLVVFIERNGQMYIINTFTNQEATDLYMKLTSRGLVS